MKALIISEDKEFIDRFDEYFSQKGFDTIIYKWLLKALDNIEEIRPNCVILSSSEYPRHWKTLVQFVKSGIGGDEIAFFLYEPNPLSSKDESKAKALGITGFITSFDKSEFDKLNDNIDSFFDLKSIPLEKLEKKIEEEQETISVSNIVSDNAGNVSGTGSFLFTHPVTGKFISGNYFDRSSNKITAKINQLDKIQIQKDDVISNFTYSIQEECNSTSAVVSDFININDEKFIIFQLG